MEEHRLRKTIIGGHTLDNDYQNGLAIGRILRQPDVPHGRPHWSWGVAFPGKPQLPAHRGQCSDLEDCKRRFKAIWSGVGAGLSDDDIAAGRLVVEQSKRSPKLGTLPVLTPQWPNLIWQWSV